MTGVAFKPAGVEPSCLYPDEAEIARLVLGPKRAKHWTGLAVVWERSGLPKIDPQTGGRYWPKVKAFLDRRENVDQHDAPRGRGIVENFSRHPPGHRGATKAARARSKAASAADEALKGIEAPEDVKAARRKALVEKPAMVAKARAKRKS